MRISTKNLAYIIANISKVVTLPLFCYFFLNMNMNLIILSVLSFIVASSLSLFYIEDFNLSNNKLIRISQILSPLFIILIILTIISNTI